MGDPATVPGTDPMMHSTNSRAPIGAISTFCFAMLALGACSNTSQATPSSTAPASAGAQRAQLTKEASAAATVVAVDPAARLVTLRREDGSAFQVKAGQEVRNFAQIAAGDQLKVQYRETLVASLRPAGEAAAPAEAALGAGRAPVGAKPAAGVGVAVRVRVVVESIDREREIVVFSLASGELRAHRTATPEGREFLKGLKVGDTVQLDYSESVALSLEKL